MSKISCGEVCVGGDFIPVFKKDGQFIIEIADIPYRYRVYAQVYITKNDLPLGYINYNDYVNYIVLQM